MDVAKKRRTAARSWVTKLTNRLRTVLDDDYASCESVRKAITELNLKLEKLDLVQSEIEDLISEEELECDIEEADKFLNFSREAVQSAEERISRLYATGGEAMPPSRAGSQSHVDIRRSPNVNNVSANLPKLQINKFHGEQTEFMEFWDKFHAIVDNNTTMPPINKFTYLQSLLGGDALLTIRGLSLTEDNYEIAKSLIKERYGREERIIFSHIQRLLNIEVSDVRVVSKLWTVYNELQSNIRSLENLGVTGDKYGVVLTPLVLSRLPPEFRMEWARVSESKDSDLQWLLEFLRSEITRRERSETYQTISSEHRRSETYQKSHSNQRRRLPSAAVLHTTDEVQMKRPLSCVFCHKNHRSSNCWNLRKMSDDEVTTNLKAQRLCFRCFDSNDHIAKNCFKKCALCQGTHNKFFCRNKRQIKNNPDNSSTEVKDQNLPLNSNSISYDNSRTDSVNFHSSKLTNQTTVMQTLSVYTSNNMKCTMLFDSGSDKSYVTSSFVRKCKPKYIGYEHVSHLCFGEKGPRNPTRRNNFEIACIMGDGLSKSINVTEIPSITVPMFRAPIPDSVLVEFEECPLSLKDRFQKSENVDVDVLIGLDNYWDLMKQGFKKGSHGLVAQETVFGWILSGSYPSSVNKDSGRQSRLHHQNLIFTELSDNLVRRFWELESLGIKDKEERPMDKTLEVFNKGIHRVGDRYEVNLPWKRDKKGLLENNYEQALKRLGNLERKLDKDIDLKVRYNEALEDLEKKQIFEEVPIDQIHTDDHPVFYLPHRPVVKESSSTTKVRPVFDASAAGSNGVSLNSCLYTGPYITGHLLDVLLRFRRWKNALSADITKAFFQIQVNSIDRDVHRFLWRKDDAVKIMRITRVPFGNTASPFLLNGTIKFHLSKQQPSRVVDELATNMYVDDWLTGADSIEEVERLKSDAQAIMEGAKMPLTKWCSNCPEIANQNIHILKEKDELVNSSKVLGVIWIPERDCISFSKLDCNNEGLIVTRRIVLSLISRIFDPMGLLQPFVMVAKLIFQDLWKTGLQWDDPIPKETEDSFLEWKKQLSRIDEFCIPRSFVTLSWDNKRSIELHAFGDASEKAYGACVYVRVIEIDGSVTSSLVMAKAKLAPVKKLTLPRLELMGALLSARLITYVRKALFLPESTKLNCWTDSTVALQWIRSDASRWKTFVQNRVTEIQELSSPDSWGHCPGIENPADILSRGVKINSLINSQMWMHGPQWLRNDFAGGINSQTVLCDNAVDANNESNESSIQTQLNVAEQVHSILPFERWGDFSKAMRISAYVLRFIKNLKNQNKDTGELNNDELKEAHNLILRETQRQYFGEEIAALKMKGAVRKSSPLFKLKPFFDEDGLLRVKGRLQMSELSFSERHPVILPKCHIATLLVRREHLALKHAGVSHVISALRSRFWIIKLRSIAKQCKRQCIVCARYDTRLPCQELAPIPRKRITRSNPFSVIGTDYAGPLYASDTGGKKLYILLFTCAVIRAVHIELVNSLSLTDFLLAFQRFVARRGMPSVIISDNAKTYKAASLSLLREYADQSPKWEFITPRAPWFGGFWERMIRSIKLCMKKTLGLNSQTRVELETTLQQVEACINSRPLTAIHDDHENNEPLTPSHFLLGRSNSHRPLDDISYHSVEVTGHDVRLMLQSRNNQLERFWKVWQTEYIRNLPLVPQPTKNKENVNGKLCLVKEDNITRMHWPIGIIVDTFPSKDGIIRTVKIKTPKGYLTRPLNKVCCLEVLDEASGPTDKMGEMSTKRTESQNTNPHELVVEKSKTNKTDGKADIVLPYVTRAGRVVKPMKL